jgi:hypothetical protein
VQVTSEGQEHNNMIAVQEPWLNENSAAFFAAKQCLTTGRRGYYISAGYAQKDLGAALRRMEEYHTEYVIELAEAFQPSPPNFLNLTALPMLQRLRDNPGCKQEPFSTVNGLVLFRCAGMRAPSGSVRSATANTVPAAIQTATIESGGKAALDSLNSSTGSPDSGRRMFFLQRRAIAACDGWAFNDRLNSTPDQVWIELTEAASLRKFYWPARRYSRPALAAVLKAPGVEKAGIACESVEYELPAGLYTMKIYQITGQSVIVSDLNTWSTAPTIVVK